MAEQIATKEWVRTNVCPSQAGSNECITVGEVLALGLRVKGLDAGNSALRLATRTNIGQKINWRVAKSNTTVAGTLIYIIPGMAQETWGGNQGTQKNFYIDYTFDEIKAGISIRVYSSLANTAIAIKTANGTNWSWTKGTTVSVGFNGGTYYSTIFTAKWTGSATSCPTTQPTLTMLC